VSELGHFLRPGQSGLVFGECALRALAFVKFFGKCLGAILDQLLEIVVEFLHLGTDFHGILILVDDMRVTGHQQVQHLLRIGLDGVGFTLVVDFELLLFKGAFRFGCFGLFDQEFINAFDQVFLIDRFEEKIVRATFKSLDDLGGFGKGGGQNDRNIPGGSFLFDLFAELIASHFRHHDIRDDQMRPFLLDGFHSLDPIAGDRHVIAELIEEETDSFSLNRAVLNNQNTLIPPALLRGCIHHTIHRHSKVHGNT